MQETIEGKKYPNVKVKLSGRDGNAFAIIGRVAEALRKKGVPREEVSEWASAAMRTHSYDELLQFVMRSVQTS